MPAIEPIDSSTAWDLIESPPLAVISDAQWDLIEHIASQAGEAGRERQQALLHLCRQAGVRMVGPNCLGIVNTAPAVRMNALFSPVEPPVGRLAFASQSGALGLAAVAFAAGRGLGFSNFVSMGNKADVSSNDLLTYWDADPNTDVLLLYLESFGNPRKFARIARRLAREKPVLAMKSGRSRSGRRAAGSHTAALAGSDAVATARVLRVGNRVGVANVALTHEGPGDEEKPIAEAKGVYAIKRVEGGKSGAV